MRERESERENERAREIRQRGHLRKEVLEKKTPNIYTAIKWSDLPGLSDIVCEVEGTLK